MGTRRFGIGIVIALAVLVAGCTVARRTAQSVVEHASENAFYVVPHPFPPGPPGSLIRVKRLYGAPNGAIAWRVLYHSRDANGDDTAVSGVVVTPTAPGPRGGRPVVGWGHPTTGTVARCGPSRGVDPFVLIEGLRGLIADGYVVASTDYPGMGVSGPSSYLIGTSEGDSVLDAVRAAREIPQAHAGARLLLWGHSQGGHAVLFAAEDVHTYAPELHLVAVAVAAPAVELGSLLNDDIDTVSGVTLGAYAFAAYEEHYGASASSAGLTSVLTPAGAAATPEIAKLCLFGQNKQIHKIAQPLVGHYLAADPQRIEPWESWLQENTPGGSPISAPILVAQGDSDTLVRPLTTTNYVHTLCAHGERVLYVQLPHTGHGLVALRVLPAVRASFKTLLGGHSLHTSCPSSTAVG